LSSFGAEKFTLGGGEKKLKAEKVEGEMVESLGKKKAPVAQLLHNYLSLLLPPILLLLLLRQKRKS